MPKARPDYQPGRFYHFFNRGAHRISVFREPDNYLFVLRRIKSYSRELGLSVIAYCLMPNHYHWLIRQDRERPASLLPQRVFNSYSKAYNKTYQHSGTLFEDNYHVVPILSESHLLHLCRYIHGNPVKDGMATHPEEWPYSNYPEWIGLRDGTLVDREFIRAHFHTPAEYRRFVDVYLADWQLPVVLGYVRQFEEG